jgi:hypothetical protein
MLSGKRLTKALDIDKQNAGSICEIPLPVVDSGVYLLFDRARYYIGASRRLISRIGVHVASRQENRMQHPFRACMLLATWHPFYYEDRFLIAATRLKLPLTNRVFPQTCADVWQATLDEETERLQQACMMLGTERPEEHAV